MRAEAKAARDYADQAEEYGAQIVRCGDLREVNDDFAPARRPTRIHEVSDGVWRRCGVRALLSQPEGSSETETLDDSCAPY